MAVMLAAALIVAAVFAVSLLVLLQKSAQPQTGTTFVVAMCLSSSSDLNTVLSPSLPPVHFPRILLLPNGLSLNRWIKTIISNGAKMSRKSY